MLVLVLFLGTSIIFSTKVSAAESTKVIKSEGKIRTEDVKNKFKELGIEVSYVKDKNNNKKSENMLKEYSDNEYVTEPIKVNSIEEVEKIIAEFKKAQLAEELESQDIKVYTTQNTMAVASAESDNLLLPSATSYPILNGSGRVSKYSFMLGLFAWKNVTFSFKYKYYPLAGCYTVYGGIDNSTIGSYVSGVSAFNWNQTSVSANVVPGGRYVDLKVIGYYVIGFDFGDFEVGAHVNGTWNIRSDDINDYI